MENDNKNYISFKAGLELLMFEIRFLMASWVEVIFSSATNNKYTSIIIPHYADDSLLDF